jgi:chromosome segregation ATPase
VASLYGKLEEAEKSIQDLKKDFTNQTSLLKSDIQSIQSTIQTHGEDLQTAKTHNTTLAQQVDENNQILTTNMGEFQNSLAQFKETLTSLGTTIGQVQTDLSGQRQDLRTVQSRTEELPRLFNAQLEEQSRQITQLQNQVTPLQDKLNADTQALRAYLEQDVKAAMAGLVADIDTHQGPMLAQIDSLQKDMEALGTHVQADASHVQELSQSVLKLREAQEVMGSLLGKRGDEIIQQAGRLSERMNTVETHQTALTEQLQSNTQKTSAHLAEVNASLNSISQALDQTSQSLSSRLAKQEETSQALNQTVQQFQQLKRDTQDQAQQVQAASQTVENIRSGLHDLETHQSGLVAKLDSDTQMTNTHLQEVNDGIQSVAQALENVSSKLNARIADQEQRLNRAMTSFQRVQGTADTSQTNLTHLNQLTETVNKLRDVINTIGTKLGERVDQHEDRLGQLAQRVNRLQSPKQQK